MVTTLMLPTKLPTLGGILEMLSHKNYIGEGIISITSGERSTNCFRYIVTATLPIFCVSYLKSSLVLVPHKHNSNNDHFPPE